MSEYPERYWHVVVETGQGKDSTTHGTYDLDFSKLKKEIVEPWYAERPFTVGGKVVRANAVAGIRITHSDRASSVLCEEVRQRNAAKRILAGVRRDEVVVSQGRECTNELLFANAETSKPEELAVTQRDPKRVFVVYGRNQPACDAVVHFLRTLKLNPTPFSEVIGRAGPSSYVGDAIKKGMAESQAIVVLFTPDEEATLIYGQLPGDKAVDGGRQQARPNVIFEAGMAIGAHEEHTILVTLGAHAELFSDILGRHILRLNNSSDKRDEFRVKLTHAGCDIDKDATGLHNPSLSGDFEACVRVPPTIKLKRSAKGSEKRAGTDTKKARKATPPTPAPLAHVSDVDASIKLQGWQRELSDEDSVKSYAYADLDQKLELPPGTSARVLPGAVQAAGYYRLEGGTTHFLLKTIPMPPIMLGGSRRDYNY
jgi:predicted nucleotide-binding protein